MFVVWQLFAKLLHVSSVKMCLASWHGASWAEDEGWKPSQGVAWPLIPVIQPVAMLSPHAARFHRRRKQRWQ